MRVVSFFLEIRSQINTGVNVSPTEGWDAKHDAIKTYFNRFDFRQLKILICFYINCFIDFVNTLCLIMRSFASKLGSCDGNGTSAGKSVGIEYGDHVSLNDGMHEERLRRVLDEMPEKVSAKL